jgi:hypothetical protein
VTPVASAGVVTPIAAAPVVPAAVITPPQPPVIPVAAPAVAERVVSRAPVPVAEPRFEPREDPRVAARVAVEEAIAPMLHQVRELQRRIEELERRPAQSAVVHAPAAPAYGAAAMLPTTPPVVSMAASPSAAASHASHAPIVSSIPIAIGSIAPRPAVLDVRAIERDTSISVDGAIDGSKRKRKVFFTFAFVLIAVFGGLFAALARSYQPH